MLKASTRFGFKIGILKTAPKIGAVFFEYLLKNSIQNYFLIINFSDALLTFLAPDK
jgi:hypothetical protein